VGQYFRQFGLTVAVSVFVSLLVARLITPLLAAYFLTPADAHVAHKEPFYIAPYARLLVLTLHHRWLTLGSAVLVLVGSFWLMGKLPAGFVPVEDRARATLSLELPPGVRLADTQAMVRTITEKLQQRPEVVSVFAEVGISGEVRKALLAIKLVSRKERALTQKQFEQDFAKTLDTVPDIRHAFTLGRSSAQRELTLELTGEDAEVLDKTARTLAEQLRTIPSLVNMTSDAALNRPEIEIVPNFEQAARLGISAQTIANAVRVATVGDFMQVVAKMRDGDRQIPIVVRLDPAMANDPRLLGNLPIPTNTGQTVLLKSVANIVMGTSPAQINRYNRERTVSFAADLRTGTTLGAAMTSVEALPIVQNLPAGVRLPKSGDTETMGEMFTEFTSALMLGLLAVYAVLTIQFRSFFQSLTIMSALPMSIGGSAVALWLTGKGIEMPVVIGLLLLFGIVAKNSILLVDCALTHEKEGYSRLESLRQAGIQRARPILMTTIAMIAGMVPAVAGLGSASNEFRAPMAIAVIGGLLSATVLSLLFVPAIYALFSDIERVLARHSRKLLGDKTL
jgi:multidrug efflux pump subunit AcrB